MGGRGDKEFHRATVESCWELFPLTNPLAPCLSYLNWSVMSNSKTTAPAPMVPLTPRSRTPPSYLSFSARNVVVRPLSLQEPTEIDVCPHFLQLAPELQHVESRKRQGGAGARRCTSHTVRMERGWPTACNMRQRTRHPTVGSRKKRKFSTPNVN